MHLVSIGLPVCNGQNYLKQTIKSILDQSYTDFEIIIVDNASTDETEKICRKFEKSDSRVSYYRNKSNIGAPANYNRVMQYARGEYFKWAAHDDLLAPEYLEKCVDVLNQRTEVILCHSKVRVIDESDQVIKEYNSPLTRLDSPRPHERFADLVLAPHACYDVFGVMRKQVLDQTPGIANYFQSDRHLLAELGLIGRIYVVPEFLFFSRDHNNRSVRISIHKRAVEWWHQVKSGQLVFPYWRGMAEYIRLTDRVALTWDERISCYGILLQWLLKNWRNLGGDIKFAARQRFGFEGLLKHQTPF
jgi:glycosyltransferase involved in cell wall biosynthesis